VTQYNTTHHSTSALVRWVTYRCYILYDNKKDIWCVLTLSVKVCWVDAVWMPNVFNKQWHILQDVWGAVWWAAGCWHSSAAQRTCMLPARPTHNAHRSEQQTSEWWNMDSCPADQIPRDAFECRTLVLEFPPSHRQWAGSVSQPTVHHMHSCYLF